MKRVRRGPVKLTDDDEVVPADGEALISSGPPRSTAGSSAPENTQSSSADESRGSPWAWLSSIRSTTTHHLDRLYQLANQPVSLPPQEPLSQEERDKAICSLDLLILRAKSDDAPAAAAEDGGDAPDVYTTLNKAGDVLSGAVAAGLKRLDISAHDAGGPAGSTAYAAVGTSEDACAGRDAGDADTDGTDARAASEQGGADRPRQTQIKKGLVALERLGRTTAAALAGRVSSALDRTADRSVDECFQLFGGGVYADLLQQQEIASARQLKQSLKAMTPKEVRSVQRNLSLIEDGFDAEALLAPADGPAGADLMAHVTCVANIVDCVDRPAEGVRAACAAVPAACRQQGGVEARKQTFIGRADSGTLPHGMQCRV